MNKLEITLGLEWDGEHTYLTHHLVTEEQAPKERIELRCNASGYQLKVLSYSGTIDTVAQAFPNSKSLLVFDEVRSCIPDAIEKSISLFRKGNICKTEPEIRTLYDMINE